MPFGLCPAGGFRGEKRANAAFRPLASYIQTILFQKGMPNYLLIPSCNSENIKNAMKHITYENRKNQLASMTLLM